MPATVANPYVNLELKIPKQNFEDFDKYTSRFKSEDGSAKGSWGHPHFPGAGGLVALSLTESGWPFRSAPHGWAAACGEEKLDISENKVSGAHK